MKIKVGDVSRRRRLADPARQRWYAHYRAVRFARRMLHETVPCVLLRQAVSVG
jgi:hypothetical protein